MLPGPIDTEIWDQPGNDPAHYDGPLIPAAESAASVVDAIEGTGFEYYAPPEFPGGVGLQHDVVLDKSADPGAFVDADGGPPPERRPLMSDTGTHRPALLPPVAVGSRLRARRPDRPPDGELRLPDRRPGNRRRRRRRPRVRRHRAGRHVGGRRPAPQWCARHPLPRRPLRRRHHGLLDRRAPRAARARRRRGTGARAARRIRVGEAQRRTVRLRPHPARQRRRRARRRHPHHAHAHAGPHPREPVLRGRRQARRRRHALPGGLRAYRPPGLRSRRDVREPHPASRDGPRLHHPVSGPSLLAGALRDHGRRRANGTTCSGSAASTSGVRSWAGRSRP